jgi:hypothetical protein
VKGFVRHNGLAAVDAQVRLARTATPEPNAPEERGPRRGMEQRMFSGRVQDDGSFEITSVPPGAWDLEVVRGGGGGGGPGGAGGGGGGRGGRGGQSALHRQPLQVQAGLESYLVIDVATARVEFTVVPPAGVETRRLRIVLVDAAEAGDKPPEEWRSLRSAQTLNVQEGATASREVAPAAYRWAVFGGGVRTASGALDVRAGQPAALRIPLEQAPPGEEPAGGPRGGRAPREPGTAQPGGGPAQPGGRQQGRRGQGR